MIDFLGAGRESLARHVQLPVVPEVVDTDFESLAGEGVAKGGGHDIGAFGDEVERGAEPEPPVHLGDLKAAIETSLAVDVVGQDEGELFAVRPAGPAIGGRTRRLIDVPDAAQPTAQSFGSKASNREPDLPGYRGLENVIRTRHQHGQPDSILALRASRSAFLPFDERIVVRTSDGTTRLRISMFGITQWPPMTPGKYLTGGRYLISS